MAVRRRGGDVGRGGGGGGGGGGGQVRTNGPGRWHVFEALRYFLERAAIPTGAAEERYFAFGQVERGRKGGTEGGRESV